ncbi:SMC-Scp complex subunit ScpB [Psychrosphaera sp. B3R10]|uniref:SMC-Scp complex subunit ScpB n=1 Tax=unclassified Psychrosphaera TaxID=2641570 RepID=UPI001C096594|nr:MULTISPECIES: SMC-Scp complex subunit ScpB [unclassified Psychrosphaera]MBU2882389.1 SMC-Scp complex subunit ScpB [Psychrosphaera sp. I2R16]MBU2989070.1 SMC-Scp complex subunit ScpB [Psychrosphaera sp. B3R10]
MSESLTDDKLLQLIEAAIFCADSPLTVEKMKQTVLVDQKVTTKRVKIALEKLQEHYDNRGINLVKVASGYRFEAAKSISSSLGYLWTERPAKYSRALLETLALIAYKQPITRGEIEDVRGVSVSTNIIRTLTERNWVKVVGHKEVPGRPSLFGTTNAFLDYFGLRNLSQLPQLMEPEALETITRRLENEFMGVDQEASTSTETNYTN